jgi:hypothetical protein
VDRFFLFFIAFYFLAYYTTFCNFLTFLIIHSTEQPFFNHSSYCQTHANIHTHTRTYAQSFLKALYLRSISKLSEVTSTNILEHFSQLQTSAEVGLVYEPNNCGFAVNNANVKQQVKQKRGNAI